MFKKKSKSVKIVWFARGGDIAKCGPFSTQIEATNAMRLVKNSKNNDIFPDNVFVWPEEI